MNTDDDMNSFYAQLYLVTYFFDLFKSSDFK